jgi:hypothetical protein
VSEATIRVESVDPCPRCQQRHAKVEFQPFTYLIRDHGDSFTHWAMCPKRKEPILARPPEQ